MIRYIFSNPSDSSGADLSVMAGDHYEPTEAELVEKLEENGCTHVALYTGATWADRGLLEWEADLVGGELVKR